VAINANPRAPIFKMADYGIVADYQEMVPLLCAAVAQAKNTKTKRSLSKNKYRSW